VYNAIAFRLQAPPFALGSAAGVLYLAYPVGIAAPLLLRRLADRLGRGPAAAVAVVAVAAGVGLCSLPSLGGVFAGLGVLTFSFLGLHSLLSGWVVDRARRRSAGTAQASSAYLLAFYTGSTVAGAAATSAWQSGGWPAVTVLCLALSAAGLVSVLLARRFEGQRLEVQRPT
jgi:YNFM family putative membrane transporter